MKLISAFLLFVFFLLPACKQEQATMPPDVDHYTCTMHPSVRSLKPNDKCPICSMDLVPVMKTVASGPSTSMTAAPAETATPEPSATPTPEAAATSLNDSH